MTTVIKNKNLSDPPFKVLVDGLELPATTKGDVIVTEAHVIGITVDDDTELPSMFTIELVSPEPQKAKPLWIDKSLELFAIGKVVEVKMGYGNDLKSLIIGEITALEPEFTFNRLPSLTVRGYDRRHRLQRGRKTRTFVQQKDSEIADQITREVGLKPDTKNSQVIHPYVLQANQTDMEFLQERARRIEYEMVVDDKTLFFRPVAHTDSKIFTLTFNDDLLEFYPRLSSMSQISEVTVRGWDIKKKKEIQGKAQENAVSKMGGKESGAILSKNAFGTAAEMISDRPVMTQAEADQLAKAHFNQVTLGLIIGEGVCLGRPDLRSGKVIEITSVGERFSGQYYVTSTSHRYGGRGYYTHFTVQRNAA